MTIRKEMVCSDGTKVTVTISSPEPINEKEFPILSPDKLEETASVLKFMADGLKASASREGR